MRIIINISREWGDSSRCRGEHEKRKDLVVRDWRERVLIETIGIRGHNHISLKHSLMETPRDYEDDSS